MNIDWQSLGTMSCVALAGAFVLRAWWKSFQPAASASCSSGCSHCPQANQPPGFVGIEQIRFPKNNG